MNPARSRAFGFVAVAAAAALGVGSAVAVAGPGKRAPRRAAAAVHAVHADVSLIKADGSTDSFVADRGTVKAKSATSVTIERKDGKTVTIALSGDTKIRGELEAGKPALVLSRAGTAFAVRAPNGRKGGTGHMRHGRVGHGAIVAAGLLAGVHVDVSLIRADGSTDSFTLDRGEVSAASSTTVALKRKDGKTVTLGVSADTKIRGKLAVGGRALAFSRGGTAYAILAVGPRA